MGQGMYTRFTALVNSGDRYAIIKQAYILGILLSLCILFISSLFDYTYDAWYCQSWRSCKQKCSQNLAYTCGYMYAEVVYSKAFQKRPYHSLVYLLG